MLEVAPLALVHLTSPYGMRDLDGDGDLTMHAGIDLRAAVGTPVFAMGSGVVRAAGAGVAGSGGGNAVDIVDDEDGRYVYLHLDEVRVRAGDRVEAGQLVGLAGNTGASRGPHLHVQWQPNWPETATADLAPVLPRLNSPAGGGGGGGGLVLVAGAAAGLWLLTKKKKRRRQ